MEQATFLSPEHYWTDEQQRLAEFCTGCLARRAPDARLRCAAQVDLGGYTVKARLSCASSMSGGHVMPIHQRDEIYRGPAIL